MDNVKYQVFISSTYSDLKEERNKILNILLMADCIPAGMENFVATDEEQFEVIKKVIDLCDYYILIIGRRYGSVNDKTKKSYTEMEYDYAICKDIPVLVFALDDSVIVDEQKEETDIIKKGKLAEFRNRAMQNRLASVWKDQTDLLGKVAIAIMQAKSEIKRPGWHRGVDGENEHLLAEIDFLRKENDALKNGVGIAVNNKNLDEQFYGKRIKLHYTENVMFVTLNTEIHKQMVTTTLDELFKFVSLRITGRKTVTEFVMAVSDFVSGYIVDMQDALIVRNKYEQLGLIESYVDFANKETIRLTDLGKQVMNGLNQ